MSALPDFAEKADRTARLSVVYFLTAIFFLLNLLSFDFIFGAGIRIPLFLMVVYYWSVYRPSLLPVWAIFVAGVLYDLVAGLPLGITALIYILVQWVVRDQRMFLMGQPYIMLWFGFCMVSLLAGLVNWGIYGLFQMNFKLPLDPVIGTAILGALFFPLSTMILRLIHKILPEQDPNFGS